VKQEGKFPYLIDKDGGWVSRDDDWDKGMSQLLEGGIGR
jgi:hypothetical protein